MTGRCATMGCGETAKRPATFACHLVVMVKLPVAGKVKTRLARGIGHARAIGFYRSALAALVGRVKRSGRWHTYLAIAPDSGVSAPVWPRGCLRLAQGGGDLGERMQRVMDQLPPGPVIIIGSDVPGITAAHIARGFRMLKGADAVIGPSPDGGYWLIGLRRCPRVPRLFNGVRWSHAETRADTLRNMAGLRVRKIDELDDVDDADDYARLGRNAGRRIPGVSAVIRDLSMQPPAP